MAAFQQQVLYGFRISDNFADIADAQAALRTLDLEIGDLRIIDGAGENGSREDLQSFSGLQTELYKTLDRYRSDTNVYEGVLRDSSGVDNSLRGNLNLSGPFGASSLRFKFYDSESDVFKYANISTSRVSAWSTTTAVPSDADPIYYGARLRIDSGGSIAVDRIQWGEEPSLKEFEGEIPTHKITTTINGNTVKLYAMKSIPLKFRGFFRTFNLSASINRGPYSGARLGTKIVNINDSNDVQKYPILSPADNPSFNYRNSRSGERDIELYYPPDGFTRINLNNASIEGLPNAQLNNLSYLDLSSNNIKDFPDIGFFAPNLTNLNLSNNPLYLATASDVRYLNAEVVSRMPSSLQSLSLSGTYYGSIQPNNALASLTNLVTLNLNRSGSAFFGPDIVDPDGKCPAVANTVQNYYLNSNDFRTFPTSGVKDLPDLRDFRVHGNWTLSDSSFSLDSTQIRYIDIGATRVAIPDLRNRVNFQTLESYYNQTNNSFYDGKNSSNWETASEAEYKFAGCGSLNRIQAMYNYSIYGYIPRFKGNRSLYSVDWYACQSLRGGRPPAANGAINYVGDNTGDQYVLYKDTFQDSPNIGFFRVLSYSLLANKGFQPGTFKNLSNLYYLYWYSYGRTGGSISDANTGFAEDLNTCSNLVYLIMPVNNFTGNAPSLNNCGNLHYYHLSDNRLTGPVPSFNRSSLSYIFLHNNQLSSFADQSLGFPGCPNLYYIYLYNNNLSGPIPNFTAAGNTQVYYLYVSNNNLSSYTTGSFAGLTNIRVLGVNNNNLTTTDLDNIIDDCYKNYLARPRRGVTVNIRSQNGSYNPVSSGDPEVPGPLEKINTLKNAGWAILYN